MFKKPVTNCIVLLAVLMMAAPMASFGQLITFEQLDTCKIYTDLSLALKNPAKVYRLHLKHKKLTEIPADVFKLSNLNELVLDRNRITEITDRITELPYLQSLSINENRIDSITPALLQMKHLKNLQLGDNYIVVIPDDIEKLSKLEVLALWDNPIDYYPNALGSLKNLTILDFMHNQMSYGTQDRIAVMFDPKKTKIYFPPPCACDDGH